jgi:uncharacterized protein (TIGR03437 family)
VGVALDSSGSLYIADYGNNRIRKVTNGTITTVAGSATNGFNGDGGSAVNASLSHPYGIAVDSGGNLYISDTGNNAIRKVVNGQITTIAGGGSLFVESGPATSAQFSLPYGVAVDSVGKVYVADVDNNRVRLLTPSAPNVIAAMTHNGSFTQGQSAATYTITLSNALPGLPTAGTVTVTEIVPAGVTLVTMSGTGWACSLNSCSRSDVLNPGAAFPPITVTVNIASTAPSQLTNQAVVSGGGSAAANAIDTASIATGTPSANAPTISIVANAEGEALTIAPNTWVEIKGTNLARAGDTRTWQSSDFANGNLPVQLDGVGVTLNGKPAYVYYISPTQVNILTPPDTTYGSVVVQLTNNGSASAGFNALVEPVSPSFFVFAQNYVAAEHLDGSLIGPASLYAGSTTPAVPGETVVLYANGFGATNVPVTSGSLAQTGTLLSTPEVLIGGVPATVLFAGLVAPGEFQFNVVIPASLGDGDQPISAIYNGAVTQTGALITIQH